MSIRLRDHAGSLSLSLPRLVISAPRGRSGKTSLSIGLCAALSRHGLSVQPFKKGPDYIDPSWLTAAARRPCRNLDLFIMGAERLVTAFLQAGQGADLALIEGAMGLYDGLDLEGSASTAQVARLLKAPVILVVDATRMTRSAAALVQGFQSFEPDVNIAGVVLNNVAQARHEAKLTAALRHYCGIEVLGALPRDPTLTIPQRHLGLVPRGEHESVPFHLSLFDPGHSSTNGGRSQIFDPAIEALRQAVETHVDLDGVLSVAQGAPPLSGGFLAEAPPALNPSGTADSPRVRIGVAMDRAFTFYYPANLEALRVAGADLTPVDTLRDRDLPPVDGLYLGGGFPEVFCEELEASEALRSQIRAAIEDGLPVYAECGGLMYLARSIVWNGRRRRMVGTLPCDIEMTDRPQGHGYVSLRVTGQNPWFRAGAELRGHEFHNSRVTNLGDIEFAYRLQRGRGVAGGYDGLVYKNVLAAYTHLHTLGAPGWAAQFVGLAKMHRSTNTFQPSSH